MHLLEHRPLEKVHLLPVVEKGLEDGKGGLVGQTLPLQGQESQGVADLLLVVRRFGEHPHGLRHGGQLGLGNVLFHLSVIQLVQVIGLEHHAVDLLLQVLGGHLRAVPFQQLGDNGGVCHQLRCLFQQLFTEDPVPLDGVLDVFLDFDFHG